MAPQPSPEAQAQGSPKRRHWLRNGRPYTAAAGFKYSEKLLEFGLPQPGRLAPMSRVMQPSLSLADDQWVDDLRLSASQRDIRSYRYAPVFGAPHAALRGEQCHVPLLPGTSCASTSALLDLTLIC